MHARAVSESGQMQQTKNSRGEDKIKKFRLKNSRSCNPYHHIHARRDAFHRETPGPCRILTLPLVWRKKCQSSNVEDTVSWWAATTRNADSGREAPTSKTRRRLSGHGRQYDGGGKWSSMTRAYNHLHQRETKTLNSGTVRKMGKIGVCISLKQARACYTGFVTSIIVKDGAWMSMFTQITKRCGVP